RLDLRRQSARDGGGQCHARRHAGGGLPRPGEAHRPAVQAAPRRDQGPLSGHHRGSARRGAAARPALRGAERPAGRCVARRAPARRRGRRQCRAPRSAADRQRGRGRRRDGHARPRLRAAHANAEGGEAGSRGVSVAPRHFLDLTEIPVSELRGMIDNSRAMKQQLKRDRAAADKPLAGRTLAMIFDKPSTRTRVSFDVAMRQLGGDVIMLTGTEMQLGRGETIADTARVLSRYVDAIMIRILSHESLIELAQHATVPVINGLTRLSHPCQVMADVMTFEEKKAHINGHTVAWTGDANNVLSSWMHAAKSFDFRLNVATPPELKLDRTIAAWAKQSGAAIEIGHDPEEAVAQVDCVVTDTWVSMGDKDGERRHNILKPYQVNARLMARAKPDAIFMHCLPAHRGDEV